MKTIEEELLTALLKANFITEEAFNTPQMIQFQRAARTDKGVSAVRQVVSIKLREYTEYISYSYNFLFTKRSQLLLLEIILRLLYYSCS